MANAEYDRLIVQYYNGLKYFATHSPHLNVVPIVYWVSYVHWYRFLLFGFSKIWQMRYDRM